MTKIDDKTSLRGSIALRGFSHFLTYVLARRPCLPSNRSTSPVS